MEQSGAMDMRIGLLRLLPLMVRHLTLENNITWRILLELKDIVELLASSRLSLNRFIWNTKYRPHGGSCRTISWTSI